MVLRSIATQSRYRQHRRSSSRPDCDFCSLTSQQIIFETKHLMVVPNIFPYAVWDFCAVTDHLMVIPKLHTEAIGELEPMMIQEYMELILRYEIEGYNFYARAPKSATKSIAHQHMHLIKTDNAPKGLGGLLWLLLFSGRRQADATTSEKRPSLV